MAVGDKHNNNKSTGDHYKPRAEKFKVQNFEKIAKYPKNCLVEVSNGCNHKCLFCYNTLMRRKVGKLNKDIFSKFISEGIQLGLEEVGLYSTGEPFINKDLDEYIERAKGLGIARVYVTSNGVLADIETVKNAYFKGLDSIKFSINGSNRQQYAVIHGKDDWEKLLKNLKNIYDFSESLKEQGSRPLQLLGSCIMTKLSSEIEEEHRSIFGKYLSDIKYLYAHNQAGRMNSSVDKISLPQGELEEKDTKPCQMLWNRYHLTSEGYLTCCCVDYEHDLVFADLNKSSLKDSWNNDLIQSVRRSHLKKELKGMLCYNCLTGKDEKYDPLIKTDEYNSESNARKLDDYNRRLENLKI